MKRKTLDIAFRQVERHLATTELEKDGRRCLIVDEWNRSWCTSSNANDQRAVTIECASDMTDPYAMTQAVFNSLIELRVDICKRNGKNKLIWIDNKEKALSYNPRSNEMIITVHRWFANKACPGDWLYSRLGLLATTVTEKLNKASGADTVNFYRVQVGAFTKKSNAEAYMERIKKPVLIVL